MHLSLKEVKLINADNNNVDKVQKNSLAWVLKSKNQIALEKIFKNKYPKSPYNFVVQLPTIKKKQFILLDSTGTLKKANNVAYLNFSVLKKMGCPSERRVTSIKCIFIQRKRMDKKSN